MSAICCCTSSFVVWSVTKLGSSFVCSRITILIRAMARSIASTVEAWMCRYNALSPEPAPALSTAFIYRPLVDMTAFVVRHISSWKTPFVRTFLAANGASFISTSVVNKSPELRPVQPCIFNLPLATSIALTLSAASAATSKELLLMALMSR